MNWLPYRAIIRSLYRYTHTFVSAVTFNDVTTTYTSAAFRCAHFSEFLLLVNLDVTGATTDIYINVEFSDDNTNFYKYMHGPFGDLRWEDGALDKKESLRCPVLAPYMRLYLVAAGTDAEKTFLMTVKGIFNR